MANQRTFESSLKFLSVPVSRIQIVEQARKYAGCNYSLCGSWVGWQEDGTLHPKSRVDCVRLLLYVARDVGLLSPDFDVNGPRPHAPGEKPLPRDEWLMNLLETNFEQLHKTACRAGDVLLFWYADHYHVALVTKWTLSGATVIEARDMDADGTGKVVEVGLHADEWNCVVSAWRIKGVID